MNIGERIKEKEANIRLFTIENELRVIGEEIGDRWGVLNG